MNEKRVQEFCDLLLVREVQRAIEWDPDTFQVHRTDFDNVTRLLALQDTITTSTRHASDVQQFGAVDHVVVFTSRNADAICLDLEAEAALVFPKSCSDSWLHAVRRDLACRIERLLELLAATRLLRC